MNDEQRDNLVVNWLQAKKNLQLAKDAERALREKIIDTLFGHYDECDEGQKTHELGRGYALKCQFKLNRKLDNSQDQVAEALDKIRQSSMGGLLIAEDLVKWEPKLNLRRYKSLSGEILHMIDEVIWTEPASPILTFSEPEATPKDEH